MTDISKPLTKLSNFVQLGNSGLRVSPLCLGAANFGESWQGITGQITKEEAEKIFNKYCDLGGNFVDTANAYHNGESEQWLGDFIEKRGNREDLVIATKYTLPRPSNTIMNKGMNKKSLNQSLRQSLKNLKTDYIDVLYIHCWDYITPVKEVLRGLDEVVKLGKVLYLGISDTPAFQVARMNAHAEDFGWTPFTVYQGRHDIGDRVMEHEIMMMCKEMGLGVCPWNVLGGGKYLGKYDRKIPNQKVRVFPLTERDYDIQDAVVKFAKELNRSPAQVLINWELQVSGITSPIIGNRTLKQFEDNVGALDFTLSKEQIEVLNNVGGLQPQFPYDFIGHKWEDNKFLSRNDSNFD